MFERTPSLSFPHIPLIKLVFFLPIALNCTGGEINVHKLQLFDIHVAKGLQQTAPSNEMLCRTTAGCDNSDSTILRQQWPR